MFNGFPESRIYLMVFLIQVYMVNGFSKSSISLMIFCNFSSAFNTIKPHPVCSKLLNRHWATILA